MTIPRELLYAFLFLSLLINIFFILRLIRTKKEKDLLQDYNTELELDIKEIKRKIK